MQQPNSSFGNEGETFQRVRRNPRHLQIMIALNVYMCEPVESRKIDLYGCTHNQFQIQIPVDVMVKM